MIIPEEVLTQVINNRLNYLRKNPSLLNDIFENLSNNQMIKLSSYVTGNQANNISAVNVVRGYPQSVEGLPSYVILLGKEEESETFINNFVADDNDPDDFQIVPVTETVNIASRNGQKYIKLSHAPQSFVNAVFDGVTYTNCFADLRSSLDPDVQKLSNNPEIIGLNSSVIPDMRNMQQITVSYQAITGMVNKYGSIFKSNYQIQVWSQNGDLTVWLYHLLKWIFQLDRNYLIKQGFLTNSYSGGEFEPFNFDKTYPTLIYRRAFAMDFRMDVMSQGTDDTIDSITTQIPNNPDD